MKKLFLKSSAVVLMLSIFTNPLAYAFTQHDEVSYVAPASYQYLDISDTTNAPNFQDGLLLAYRDGNYGYLDTAGNEVIDFIYDDAMSFNEGHAPVYVDGLWGIINKNGAYVVPPGSFSLIKTTLGDYLATDLNGSTIIGKDGRVIIPSTTDRISITEEYYVVNSYMQDTYYVDGVVAYVHEYKNSDSANSLNEVQTVKVFPDGYRLTLRNNRYALINDSGSTVFTYGKFDDVIPLGKNGELFSEEGAAIYIRFNSLEELVYGFIYEDGKIDYEDYVSISEFSEGYAWAQKSNGRYDIVNLAGEVTESPNHTINSPMPFVNGMALVYNSDFTKITLISPEGDLLTSFTYSTMGNFNGEGAAAGKTSSSSSKEIDYAYGVVDKEGAFHEIPTAHGIDVNPIGDYFVFKQSNREGLADSTGEIVLPAKYDDLSSVSSLNTNMDFSDMNVFYVRNGAYFGIIDENGNEIIPIEYGRLTMFESTDGLYCVQADNSTYFLSENDLSLVYKLDFVSTASYQGLFAYQDNGKWGISSLTDINDYNAEFYATSIFNEKDTELTYLSADRLNVVSDRKTAIEAIEEAIDLTLDEPNMDARKYFELYDYTEEALTRGSQIDEDSSTANYDDGDLSVIISNQAENHELAMQLFENNDIPMYRDLETTFRITLDNETLARYKISDPSDFDKVDNLELHMPNGGIKFATKDISDLEVLRVRFDYDDEALKVSINDDDETSIGLTYTVLLPYEQEDADLATIVKDVDMLGGNYDRFSKFLYTKTSESGTFTTDENSKSFTDINYLPWEMRDSIYTLSAKGIVNGVSANEFAPEKIITRAEISALMIRMLDLEKTDASTTFVDVTSEDWYYETAIAATEAGLIAGYEDNTFGGSNPITRGEMLVMISRYAENYLGFISEDVTYDPTMYADGYSVQTWAQQAVTNCTELGITIDRTDAMLNLTQEITRSEAAVLLNRLFDLD